MGPFMLQSSVSMTFFMVCYAQNFFFTGESVSFFSVDCLYDSGSK